MADIQSWRRGIPARASSRPPASPHETPSSTRPSSPANIPLRSVRSAVNLLSPARPTLDRLSSFLSVQGRNDSSNGSPSRASSVADSINEHWLGFSHRDRVYQPDADEMADTLQRIAMNLDSGQGLPVEHTGLLLHVLEGYRKLLSKNQKLEERVGKEKEKNSDIMLAYESAIMSWEEEKKVWEREVKRLEILIAEGKDGMEALVLARAGSLVRKELAELRSRDPELRGRMKHDIAAKAFGTKPMLVPENKDVERSRFLSPMRPSESIITGRPPQNDHHFDLAKLKLSTGRSSDTEETESEKRARLLPQNSMGEFPCTVADWSSVGTSSSSGLGGQKSHDDDNDDGGVELSVPQHVRLDIPRGRSRLYVALDPAKGLKKDHKRDFSFTKGDDHGFNLDDGGLVRNNGKGRQLSGPAISKTFVGTQGEMIENLKETMRGRSPASGGMLKDRAEIDSPPDSPVSPAGSFIEMKGPKQRRFPHPHVGVLDELSSSNGSTKTPGRDDSANSIVTIKRFSNDGPGSTPNNDNGKGNDPTALAAAKAAVQASFGSGSGSGSEVLSPGNRSSYAFGDGKDSPNKLDKSREQI